MSNSSLGCRVMLGPCAYRIPMAGPRLRLANPDEDGHCQWERCLVHDQLPLHHQTFCFLVLNFLVGNLWKLTCLPLWPRDGLHMLQSCFTILTWGRIGQMILADTKFNGSSDVSRRSDSIFFRIFRHFWFGAHCCVEETYNTPKSLCFLLEVWPREGDHGMVCLLVVSSMKAWSSGMWGIW